MIFSEEFTSESEDDLYKRYKMKHFRLSKKVDKYYEEMALLQKEAYEFETRAYPKKPNE